MAKRTCDREPEVLDRLLNGHVGDELRAHIDGCPSCGELFAMAHAIVEDRSELMREAHLPGAGLVWWRSNLRAQREAAQATVRAGSVIQVVLIVAAIAAALAILGVSIDLHTVTHAVAGAMRTFAVPLIALAAWLILAPVAVYFAVTEK